MRKVTFLKNHNPILKLMIYETSEGVYLFGFDTLADSGCIWDQWHESIDDADDYCEEEYGLSKEDWIEIPNPSHGCRHDFIIPTKIGTEGYNFEKLESFGGLTGNERLFESGLMDEFDKAKLVDKTKASRILTQLGFDHLSITRILS